MILEQTSGGGALVYYTDAEKEASFETGYVVPDNIISERMEAEKVEYLESELHLRLLQNRIDSVLLKYPEFSVDFESMYETADSLADVRDKFDYLRALNSEVEQSYLDSDKYFRWEEARNAFAKRLIDFQYAYILAIEEYGNRRIELNLTIVDLPKQLNREFGNLSSIEDIPHLFMEGIGKSVGVITISGTSILKDLTSGVVKGLGLDLGIDKDLLVKIAIGAGAVIAVIIAGLIAFQYSKSYISEKGAVKARGK